MGPLGLSLFRNREQNMKRLGPLRAHTGLPTPPGFACIAHHFKERCVVFFIVRENLFRIGENQDIAFCRQPFEVGQTFFERIPVVSEVVGKIKGPRELCKEPCARAALPAPQNFRDESFRNANQRLCPLSGLENEQGRPGRSGRLQMNR